MEVRMAVFSVSTVCLLVTGLFASAGAGADVEWNQTRFNEQIGHYIQSGLSCHNNPSLSIAVVKDGQVILAKGFGNKTLHGGEPVTEKTLFGIASLTKAFAATLMLKLLEDSDKYSLTTQIRSLFGNDEIFKSELRSRYATIEDLLAHRIGLPSNNRIRLDDTLTRNNVIDRIKYLNLKGGFRTSFYYSNLMYGLVTSASEKIGGKSWEKLVKEKIFTPLSMTSSDFVTTADPTSLDMVTGYVDVDGELFEVPFEVSRRWGELCGSGCILSNAVDMAKWMLFQLNQGRNASYDTVLKSDTLNEAHNPQNAISPPSKRSQIYSKPTMPVTLSDNIYGLGWRLGHYRGFPIITHSGSTYGYRALLTLLPNMDIGVFTVMTGDDPNYIFRTNLHSYAADLALGLDPWLDNNTVCSFPEPWQTKKPKTDDEKPDPEMTSSRPLENYAGAFKNPAYGVMDVYKNSTSNRLMAKIGYGQFILYPKSKADQFFGEGFGLLKNIMDFSTLIFAFDANSTVSNLTIPSFESNQPPVFKRIKVTTAASKKSNGSMTTLRTCSWSIMMFVAMVKLLPYCC